MKKMVLVTLLIILSLMFTGCVNNSPTEVHLSDNDQIATIVAGTLSSIPSLTPTLNPTATFTPANPSPTVSNIQTYIDPDFGFRFQYDVSWQVNAKSGSGMIYNDGKGRMIEISKDGYMIRLMVVDGPGDVEGCVGTFSQDPSTNFWTFTVDDVELWRIKAEQGDVNGMFGNNFSSLDIISPLELYQEPKTDAYGTDWGSYTCEPQISNHGVSIHYLLPVSIEELEAGQFNQGILTEMDNILSSLTWRQ